MNIERTAPTRVGHADCKWCQPDGSSNDPPKWCREWEGCPYKTATRITDPCNVCEHGMTIEDGCMHCERVTTWASELERLRAQGRELGETLGLLRRLYRWHCTNDVIDTRVLYNELCWTAHRQGWKDSGAEHE